MKSFNQQYEHAKKIAETKPDTQSAQTQNQSAEELAKKMAKAYEGKSDAAMWKNIIAEAEKSKREGTLSNEQIEEFYNNFAPMLNGFQKRTLRQVVNRLKEL